MNGRTYDTRLGRFMQADIVVQSPTDTQSYNRYSYLTNNPLNGTDPSGYFSLKELVGVAVAAVGTYICMGNVQCGYPGWAMVGAASGGSQAVANGGDFSQIVQGAAWGAFSAAAFYGVGNYFQSVSAAPGTAGTYEFGGNFLTPGQIAGQVTAHGVVSGAISALQGGNFGHGFISAGFTKAVTGSGLTELGSGPAASMGETALAAIVGGTASVMSGGKFANGATTGAFGYLFNTLAHPTNTYESGVQQAILRGDVNELRALLGNGTLAADDALIAQRALAAMETLGAEDSAMLASRYGVDWANRVYHIFEGIHQGPVGAALLSKFGSPLQAMSQVQRALEVAKPSTGMFTNAFRATVNVDGIAVQVRGAVVNDVYKIGTVLKW